MSTSGDSAFQAGLGIGGFGGSSGYGVEPIQSVEMGMYNGIPVVGGTWMEDLAGMWPIRWPVQRWSPALFEHRVSIYPNDVFRGSHDRTLGIRVVEFLFALEVLLFTSSTLLHASVIFGSERLCAEYGMMLFGGGVIVGAASAGFIKPSLGIGQLRRCPNWMWKGTLTLLGYVLCIAPLVKRSSPWALSGIPIGPDATCICILYSVLWTDYLPRSEVIRKALQSAIFVAVSTLLFLA